MRRGVPDFHRSKMRAVVPGITDALHDCELAVAPDRQQRLHGRMKAGALVQLQNKIPTDTDARTQGQIIRISEWNDGIQAVVAAVQLDQNQYLAVMFKMRLLSQGKRRRRQ